MARRIKHLFVSYSRDDKHWAYEFAKALRDDLTYTSFVDYRNIHIGADWWRTICENIEACDCAVYIMTPKSVESIYCRAEIDYLLALNKPILPIMLKACAFPDELSRKRVQYLSISDEMQMDRVLLELQKGLADIQYLLYDGEYYAPSPLPARPDEPKPKDPRSAEEVFDLAAEAAEVGQLDQAESLFAEVIKADSSGNLGRRAQHRLDELRSYVQVARRAVRPATLRDARELWREHCESYGREFDPLKLADKLDVPTKRSVEPVSRPETPAPEIVSIPRTRPVRPTSLDLMPAPFAWIEIPGAHGWMDTCGPDITLLIPTEKYWISKYPITNAQFATFIEAGGYKDKQWWTDDGWKACEEGWSENSDSKPAGTEWAEPRFWTHSKWNAAEQPVVGVSWYEAVAFCLWLSDVTGENIMLPSDSQWQYAAHANDGGVYPWGKDWDCRRCNNSVNPCRSRGATPVRQFEGKGDSPFGVVDMAGNVWEWCLTDYIHGTNDINTSDILPVLCGGSWDCDDVRLFRSGFCDGGIPYARSKGLGFRICRFS